MTTPLRPLAALLLALGGLLAGCSADGGTAVDLTPTGSPTGSAVDGAPDAAAQLTTDPPAGGASGTAGGDASPDGPAEASVGGVVQSFPSDLVPTYPGAEVLLTSASTSTAPPGQLDVTLAGRTGEAPEEVVEFYRRSLTAAGFTEAASPGGQGVLAATFTRDGGTEVLSVAVTAAGTGSGQQFTVGGTVASTAS